MGYDMSMNILKKELIQEAVNQLKITNLTDDIFNDLFEEYLFMYLYPEEYGIEKGWEARNIYDCSSPILQGILDVQDDVAIMIEKESYSKLCRRIETKLRKLRLSDFVTLDDYEITKAKYLIELYKSMMSAHIDWSSEIVVFDHGW